MPCRVHTGPGVPFPCQKVQFPCNFPSSQMKAQAAAGWPHASQDGDFLHAQLLGTSRVGFLTFIFTATRRFSGSSEAAYFEKSGDFPC